MLFKHFYKFFYNKKKMILVQYKRNQITIQLTVILGRCQTLDI